MKDITQTKNLTKQELRKSERQVRELLRERRMDRTRILPYTPFFVASRVLSVMKGNPNKNADWVKIRLAEARHL